MLVSPTVSIDAVAYVPLVLGVVGIEMDDREGLLVLSGFRLDIALEINSAVQVPGQAVRGRERMGPFSGSFSNASVRPDLPPIVVQLRWRLRKAWCSDED
jgi:hypothetical protein